MVNLNAEKFMNENLFVDISFKKFWEHYDNEENKKIEKNKKIDEEKEIYQLCYDIFDENIHLKIEKFEYPKYQNIRQLKIKPFFKC